MATTIQVQAATLRKLRQLKQRTSAASYDELVSRLVDKEIGVAEDLFGADRGKIRKFRESDRLQDRA